MISYQTSVETIKALLANGDGFASPEAAAEHAAEIAPVRRELAQWVAGTIIDDIRDLILAKKIPGTVKTFSELHDYCDANVLGVSEQLWSDLSDVGTDEACTVLNEAQGFVQAWLNVRQATHNMVCKCGQTWCSTIEGSLCPKCKCVGTPTK